MTGRAHDFCDHCRLPLGPWPHAGEAQGETGKFCCYGCFIGWQAAHGDGDAAVAAGFLIRLGLGGFLAMNIMLFSLLIYAGAFDGVDAETLPYIHMILWALATPVLFVLGGPFFRETVVELTAGRLPPSLLIALGSGSAYLYSAIASVQGADRVYFDTVAMVLVLFTLGRYLEASGRARATRSLVPMLEAECRQVRVVEGGAESLRGLAEVMPGMLVRVMAGERILIDGVVREGVSQAEEISLTGEPGPVAKSPGSLVLAGSENCDGPLLIVATACGLESRWIGICRDVRNALSQPARAQRVAEIAAKAFVPLVILLAAAASWANWHDGGGAVMMSGLAVLVVACPCALGLAAPLATSIATAELSRRGIVLRSGAALEALAGVRTVALDKTGTLTAGRIRCLGLEFEGVEPDEALRRAAAVTSRSLHPLSKAICRLARDRDIDPDSGKVADVEIVPGWGIRGVVAGDLVLVGSERWLRLEGVRVSCELEAAARTAAAKGYMLAFAAWHDEARVLFTFDDATHPEAGAVIRSLERDGLGTVILTGDGRRQTERLCRSVGAVRWFAELTPQEKRETIEQLSRDAGPMAMVGDGVNDALAMASAAVGISVGEGTELARETAEVVLPPGGLALLPGLLATARATRRAIATNLVWAFSYNGAAVTLALAGVLQPVIAAALMAGSSVFVVMNTLFWMKPDQKCGAGTFRAHSPRPSEILDRAIG